MRNQQAIVVVSFLLVTLLASAGCVAAAPKYKISYVVGQADELLNTAVTVEGIVLDVTFAEQPSRHKYEYRLQDEETGEHLDVYSWTGAPEENTFRTVTGTVKMVEATPVLMVKSVIDFTDWRVWALIVLIVAAIVLLVMLFKPAPEQEEIVEWETPHESEPAHNPPDLGPVPPISGTMRCPSCYAEIPDDSRFCQVCSADLSGSGLSEDDGGFTVEVGEPEPAAPPKTVLISSETNADLIVTESPAVQASSRWVLTGQNQKIGRAPSMDIRVADDGVSSEHAMIWWDMDAKSYMLQDNNSTNGTYVNGQRVSNRTQLADGDEIRVGKTKMRFRMNTESNDV